MRSSHRGGWSVPTLPRAPLTNALCSSDTPLSRAVLTFVSSARFLARSAVRSTVTADLWRSSVPPTPRQLARERTEAEILRIAREHLCTTGPADLSLRAIARELGVVSSAIYRYVSCRDDLLTLLVIDGYTALGDAVDQAISAVDDSDHLGAFLALGRTVRTWALAEPARYALLYGTPVPGYDAPGERTTEPGTRVIIALAHLAEEAWHTGHLHLPDLDDQPT